MNTLMRFLLAPALLLSLLLAGCDPSDAQHRWQLEIYDPASDTAGTLATADITHKLLLINYWAEWCKPCIEEMPELQRFARDEQTRVIVLGVNFDDKQGEVLHEAMRKVGMNFPAITNQPATVFTLPEISGLPTTLILDERGVLKEQLLGPQTYDSLQAAINRVTKP